LSSLEPRSDVTLVFKKPGYQDVVTTLVVPDAGKELRLLQPLALAQNVARVSLSSEPAGAQVVQNGQLLAGVTTPAEVLVEAGKPVRFVLTMASKVPAAIEAFTPAPGADIAKAAKLVDGFTLDVTSNIAGHVAIAKAPHCAGATPVTCTVAKGDYIVELAVPNAARLVRRVSVKANASAAFELGTVEPTFGETLAGGAKRVILEAGARQVTVVGPTGERTVNVVVKPAGITVAK